MVIKKNSVKRFKKYFRYTFLIILLTYAVVIISGPARALYPLLETIISLYIVIQIIVTPFILTILYLKYEVIWGVPIVQKTFFFWKLPHSKGHILSDFEYLYAPQRAKRHALISFLLGLGFIYLLTVKYIT